MRTRIALAAVLAVAVVGVVGTVAAQLANSGPKSVYVPIDAYRVVDTRDECPGDFSSAWLSIQSPPQAYIVDLTYEHTCEGSAQRIPADATAVAFNVTVARTTGRGFVQVASPGTTAGETSTVNWISSGQVVANSGNVTLGAGSLPLVEAEPGILLNPEVGDCSDGGCALVYLGGEADASTHWALDVTGYYVEQ